MIVVVDFDNTIALGNGFSISDKIPNTYLIEKINSLKASGNYIKIVTARGAYNSTLEERTSKYYTIIKEYLDKNGVLYDEISFNKEFADIYIDDLAIRPNEVIITKDLSSSFTDNIVTRINDTVIKSGKTITDEYEWYNAYEDKNDIPEILNITRHSLIYKYIEKNGSIDFSVLTKTINKYRQYKPLNDLTFDSYIENIRKHLSNNKHITNGDKLLWNLKAIENEIKPTFAHGDLSIDNIITTNNGLKFIDPLYGKDKFGSHIVDYAKLLFSIKFYKGDIRMFNTMRSWGTTQIDILIASECVRVASYKSSFSFISENLINEL